MHTPNTSTISDASIRDLRVKDLRATGEAPLVTFILAGTAAIAICSVLAIWAIENATITPSKCQPYSLSDCGAATSELLP